jgi:hypothetical protein
MVLPFEDEVLVVLHKGELHHTRGRRAEEAERRRLVWRVNHTAKVLGFTVTRTNHSRERWGEWLHISLRAEAERR